jgi:hypothetical protein
MRYFYRSNFFGRFRPERGDSNTHFPKQILFNNIRPLKLQHKMAKENIGQQPAINIEISEEVAEGIYSNLAIISHSNAEFVVDFIRLMPNLPKAKVKSRIILTPQHAKRLLYALRDNVQKFEMQFGKIEEPDQPLPPMNFGAPVAQA